MCPLVAFLFIGALDMGYYSYALICVESATRVAAIYTSTNALTAADSLGACAAALGELNNLPNVGMGTLTCLGNPVTVTARALTGAGSTQASQVTVTYQSMSLIPIPGVMAKQFTWTRTVKMPLRITS